jgi:Protein of unknown function (DUF541)
MPVPIRPYTRPSSAGQYGKPFCFLLMKPLLGTRMRYALLTCLFVVIGFQYAAGQTQVRTIEVVGRASRIVDIDQLYVTLIIQQRQGNSKASREKLKEIIISQNLSSEVLTVPEGFNIIKYIKPNDEIEDYRNHDGYVDEVIIIFNNSLQIEPFFQKLNASGFDILDFEFTAQKNSKEDEIKMELYTEALVNARKEANFILSIEKLQAGKIESIKLGSNPTNSASGYTIYPPLSVLPQSNWVNYSNSSGKNSFPVKTEILVNVIVTFEIIDKP